MTLAASTFVDKTEAAAIACEPTRAGRIQSERWGETWIIWTCALYLGFAWILTIVLDRPAPTLSSPLANSFAFAFLTISAVAILLRALRPLWRWREASGGPAHLATKGGRLGWGILLSLFVLLFLCAFSTAVKSAMSVVADFSWDKPLADLDAALHLGQDAWRLYVPIAELMPLAVLEMLYMPVWMIQALALPVAVALLERNKLERCRYFFCFFVIWIVLGNFTAISFLSGGPIFFAQLTGESRFEPFLEWLNSHAQDVQLTILVQKTLWQAQVTGDPLLGAGISAFPSVHVAMATLTALYCGCRLGGFGWALALSYLFLIQIGSVVFGWHYAIDGYFSIIFVWATWRLASTIFSGSPRARSEESRNLEPLTKGLDSAGGRDAPSRR